MNMEQPNILLIFYLLLGPPKLAYSNVIQIQENIFQLLNKIPPSCLPIIVTDTNVLISDAERITLPFLHVNTNSFRETRSDVYKWAKQVSFKLVKNLSCKLFMVTFDMQTKDIPEKFTNFLLGRGTLDGLTSMELESWNLFGTIVSVARSYSQEYLHFHYCIVAHAQIQNYKFSIHPEPLLPDILRITDNIILLAPCKTNPKQIVITCRIHIFQVESDLDTFGSEVRCTGRLFLGQMSFTEVLSILGPSKFFMWPNRIRLFGNIPANPFINNYRVPLSPEEYLISIVISKLNFTEYKLSVSGYKVYLIDQMVSTVSNTWSTLGVERLVLLHFEQTVLLTCFTYDAQVSFSFYWKAFSLDVWAALVVFFVLLTVLLHLLIQKYHSSIDFQAWLFYFRYLVDDPVNISSNLEASLPFLYLTYPWIGVSIIFTVLYSSMLISELNMPFRNEKIKQINESFCPLTSLKDTGNIRIYWANTLQMAEAYKRKTTNQRKLILTNDDFDAFLKQWQDPNCFSLLSNLYNKFIWGGRELISDSFRYYLLADRETRENRNLNNRKNRHYPKLDRLKEIENLTKANNIRREDFLVESLIEQELIECKKSVFLAGERQIQMESKYLNLNYRNKFYVVRNTSIFPALNVFGFRGPITRTKFAQFTLWILESGIYKQVDESVINNKYFVRKFTTEKFGGRIESYVDKVRIKGSIQTLFFLGLSSSVLCAFVFCFEYGKFVKSQSTRFQATIFQIHASWRHFSNAAIYNKLIIAISKSDFIQEFIWNPNLFCIQRKPIRVDSN